jgi:hypothetical protein
MRRAHLAAPMALLFAACSSGVTDPPAAGTGGSGATAGHGGAGMTTGGSAGAMSSGGTSAAAGTGGSAAGAGATSGNGGSLATGGSGGTGGSTAGAGAVGGDANAGTGGTAGSADPGGSGGAGTQAGAGGTSGGSTGSGGSSGGSGPATFDTPDGTIPNAEQPPTTVNLPKDQWQKGLISPSLLAGKQLAQPSVVNGYLVFAGNEEFWIYDVSNPTMPRQLATFATPNKTGGEAESHTVSFARYGDTFYMVTIGGRGIDIWDVSTASDPEHVKQLAIPGTNYGDYTNAVWGVAWQGQYIYVGATNNGIKVVDAADPAAARVVKEVPTSAYGNVSAGPLEAVGNVLVVMTPKENGGIATLDISDPLNPTRLASITAPAAYIGMFYKRHVYMIGLRAWDVLSNPRSITAMSTLTTEGSEYMSFQDDYLFLGHVRAEIGGTPGASKIDVKDPRAMKVTSRVWGRLNLQDKNDDQFTLPIGNLLVIGDDQAPYAGWVIGVHQTAPDTKAPVVDTILPANEATAVNVKSRIGISFTDNIELATVNAASFIVRPVGGQALAGRYSVRMGVLNFDPDQDLAPGTTYEVVLPQGGVSDLVGNGMATEFKSTFTTN